ncbi:MAG: GNAT family N-acetyltransferase [Bacteroidales bacterium]|nr:GNAT family N-acetyltransferase [Bacteroidales bacterium]
MQHRGILELRNLPEIRRWMTNSAPIEWENHLNFVSTLKSNKDRRYFAIFRQGNLVATYNLTKESDTIWERGIITSPMFQGSGSTLEIEKLILDSLPKSEFSIITAKVKLDNLRSIRYHEKVGFMETIRDDQYVYFKLAL